MSPTMADDLQVALDDRCPRPHERVHARARDPRLHVVADLARLRAALAHVVGEGERAGVQRRRRGGRSRRRSRARASRAPRTSTVLMVSIECGASPERMFARLAPSSCSSPRPSEWRRSSSCASRGWLVTIARPRSFSHQRKAGMSSLSPCSSPAWHAPVCDDQSVSQRSRRWVPSRSQRAITGALPSRSARRRTSWARPSISRNTTPGTSDAIAAARGAPGGARRCAARSRRRRWPAARRPPW